jgi:hypothetical protein
MDERWDKDSVSWWARTFAPVQRTTRHRAQKRLLNMSDADFSAFMKIQKELRKQLLANLVEVPG